MHWVRRWWLVPTVLLAAFLAAWAIFVLRSQGQAIETQGREITGLSGGLSTAEGQLVSHSVSPIPKAPSVIISEAAGAAGPAGSPGAQGPGPSDAQVAAAVGVYLQAHPVPGVSSQQVAAAVAAYLSASPAPSGPAGPGPSDQQIADAVASYMAANPAPSGPAGPQGSPGADGSPGPSGAPGRPPAGWTWTDPSGVQYACAEDDQTPAPYYTCTSVPSPTPSASSASPSASSSPTAPPASASAVADPTSVVTAAPLLSTPGAAPGLSRNAPLAWLIGVPFYRRGL